MGKTKKVAEVGDAKESSISNEEKVIDTLCLGVYARILLKCSRPGVSQRQMMSVLLGIIDPDNHCNGTEVEGDQDHFVSKLLSFKINLPASGSTITNAASLARNITVSEVKERFTPVINLLDNDKRRAIIGALYRVIENDASLKNTHRELFTQCMGNTVENVINSRRINFSHILAGMLLYVVLLNDNKKGTKFVTAIKKWDIVEKYSSFDVVFTQTDDMQLLSNWQYPDGLANYMKRLKNQYNEIPTLLHDEPFKPFRDYYVPNDISTHMKDFINKNGFHSNVIREVKIENVTLNKVLAISHAIILSGIGGLGKSMMMRHLLLSCIDDYEKLGIIPFFIAIKDYDSNYASITEYVCSMLKSVWPEATVESIEAILEHRNALLLFDGLDEISMEDFITFTKKLNDFMVKYLDNFFIISSRPYSKFNSFHGFSLLQLQPFTKEQALDMVDRYNYFANSPKIQRKFRDLLDTKLYYTHTDFSNNPLLLSIMMFVFKNEADIPTEKYKFYERAYAVLSAEHDASKDQYIRRLVTGLNADQFAACFAYFCAITYADSKVSFDLSKIKHYLERLKRKVAEGKILGITMSNIDDITPEKFAYDTSNNLCIFFRENTDYAFIHRSFQEYFCARYFHSLLDEKLQIIIPIFDKNDLTKKEDLTLSMLYDMKPAAMELYMIIPYLKNLIEQCEHKNGVWTFLETIYYKYHVVDGCANTDDEYCLPRSNLYSFIRTHYGIPELYVDIRDFPDNWSLIFDEFLYIKAIDQEKWESDFRTWYRVNIDSNPALEGEGYGYDDYEDYKERETETQGYVYEFNWEKIRKQNNKKLIAAIEDETKPFMKEYLAIKNLLVFLQEKTERNAKNDSDLEQIL